MAIMYFVFLWLLMAGVINTPTGYVAAYVTKYVMWIILHGSVFIILSVLRRERMPAATEGDTPPNHLIHGNANIGYARRFSHGSRTDLYAGRGGRISGDDAEATVAECLGISSGAPSRKSKDSCKSGHSKSSLQGPSVSDESGVSRHTAAQVMVAKVESAWEMPTLGDFFIHRPATASARILTGSNADVVNNHAQSNSSNTPYRLRASSDLRRSVYNLVDATSGIQLHAIEK